MAIEDGCILAAMIARHGDDLGAALVAYERMRAPRAKATVLGSRTRAKENHLASPWARFKRDVRLPPDLLDQTGRLIEQSALDALAIAAKAGSVVSGFAKVENALTRYHVLALLHAAEAAPDGVKKLNAALHRNPDTGSIPVIQALSGAQLDLALGRPNVIHAALLAGSVSDTFLARLQRLERFRTGDLGTNRGASAGSSTGNTVPH